ncbi:hypothetical protein IKE88_02550 [Candidatus Saccharibacteria bacterium]|nr:hypothetical protein [Candidatus Saccharibacteria bacterium]
MDDTQFMQSFDQYVDLLVEKKGLDSLPDDKKDRLKEEIKKTLIEEFNKEVLRQLPEDKLDEFEQILDDDSKTIEDAGVVIKSAGLDMGEILKTVLESFQKMFLGEAPAENDSANDAGAEDVNAESAEKEAENE